MSAEMEEFLGLCLIKSGGVWVGVFVWVWVKERKIGRESVCACVYVCGCEEVLTWKSILVYMCVSVYLGVCVCVCAYFCLVDMSVYICTYI